MSDAEEVRKLLTENMSYDDVIEFRQMQKQAFRIAFDYLHACFPPLRDATYWTNTMEILRKRTEEHKTNRLLWYLMNGVYDYLNEAVKDLPQKEEQTVEA